MCGIEMCNSQYALTNPPVVEPEVPTPLLLETIGHNPESFLSMAHLHNLPSLDPS
jgi:hypothetical protein